MKALLDFVPKVCPGCGAALKWGQFFEDNDWFARASFYCRECGCTYQFAPTELVDEAATVAGGDLAR